MKRIVRGRSAFVLAAVTTAAALLATMPPSHAAHSQGNPWPGRWPLSIAHRGGALEAPGNTLAAFRTAVRNEADMLELDVQETADGVLVLRHDDTVDATTDGSGLVDELTFEQIAGLDAAYWFVPGCGACHGHPDSAYAYRGFATGERPVPPELGLRPADFRVPTLERVLREFPDTPLTIELKNPGYEAAVADLLARYDRSEGDTIVTSMHESAIDRFAELDPGVSMAPGPATIGLFAASTLGPLPGVPLPGYEALQVPRKLDSVGALGTDFVDDAHRHDLAVHVWTVNDRGEMARLLDLGVDGIMTDRPSVLADVIAGRAPR